MADVKYSKKYQPLFKVSSKIRYKHVVGGRGSAKSHAVSSYLLTKTFNENEVILFSRYTMTSAEISVIPEFKEKIELLGCNDAFHVSKTTITNKITGSKIIFKGLQTGSGNQTAAIKSINGLTCWVLDEAEELVDESLFNKINLSIRKKGVTNEVILVYNSTYRNHWIYKRFYEKIGHTEPFNGVVGNTVYIYTTYFDNYENLEKSWLEDAEKCKNENTEEYEHAYLGYFASHSKGLVYKHWKHIREAEIPSNLPMWYAIDFGFSNSHNAMVRCMWDADNKTIYYHEIDYTTGRQPKDIATLLREDWLSKKTVIYDDGNRQIIIKDKKVNGVNIYDFVNNPTLLTGFDTQIQAICQQIVTKMIKGIDVEVICDAARPEAIAYLRETDINATSCIKGSGSVKAQIEMMKDVRIFYTVESINIAYELGKYAYPTKKDVNGAEYTLDDPIKMYDDLMDACRYGYCTPKLCNLI